MNADFQTLINRLPTLYKKLMESNLVPMSDTSLTNIPAIYIFYENDKPVYVGRTRKLRERMQSHVRNSHNSATFAFKRARKKGGYEKASYKKEGSRSDLVNGVLKDIFAEEIEKIRAMKIKYVEVANPNLQYLLELYTAMELKTDLTEFDTH